MLLPTAQKKTLRFDERRYSDKSPRSSGRSWLLIKICLAQPADNQPVWQTQLIVITHRVSLPSAAKVCVAQRGLPDGLQWDEETWRGQWKGGCRAQGARLMVFRKLNCTEKGAHVPSTSRECNGSFGAG